MVGSLNNLKTIRKSFKYDLWTDISLCLKTPTIPGNLVKHVTEIKCLLFPYRVSTMFHTSYNVSIFCRLGHKFEDWRNKGTVTTKVMGYKKELYYLNYINFNIESLQSHKTSFFLEENQCSK